MTKTPRSTRDAPLAVVTSIAAPRRIDDAALVEVAQRDLSEIAARFRNRPDRTKDRSGASGAGMVALVTGPLAASRTLAAEALASELGAGLLRVDLAAASSKWIGETEKNLEQVFRAAEESRAVLLFDEADALFGKRTGTADAHDRYANLEVSYLRQRLEHYSGLVIVASNSRASLDPALLGRFDAVLDLTITRPRPDRRRT